MLLACGMRGLGGAGGWGWCTFFFRSGDDCLISYTKWVGCKYMYEIVLYCVRIAVLVFFKCLFIGIMCERSKVQTELRD